MATKQETAKLLKEAKKINVGKALVKKAADMTNKSLGNLTKADVKKFINKAPKGTLLRTAAGAGAGGIAGIFGPAAVFLTVVGSQMKKGSALSKFLASQKDKDLPKAMSAGAGRSRTKTGPAMRAKKSAMTDAQRKSGGKGTSQAAAFNKDKARGKVGPKRNVVKTSTGVLRGKDGKAVKFGKGTAAYKKMMERRNNR
tara:strand:+ start:164 stop:757 length:594 start_codon:yes stop_codon:yes gene_type:complete